MWTLIQKFSWNNHEVFAENENGIIRVSLCIEKKIYSGYSTGDDISSANIDNALLDLQKVLEKHANGEYIAFAKKNYNYEDLIHSQNICKHFFNEQN